MTELAAAEAPIKTERSQFADIMAHDLRAIEHEFDTTLARLGEGLVNMTAGRKQAGLAAQAGQKGLEHYGEALSQAIAARGAIVRAHNSFARDARSLGIPITMNPWETKPDSPEQNTPPG